MLSAEGTFTVCCSLRSHFNARPAAVGALLDFVERSAGKNVRDFFISHSSPQGDIPSGELATEVLRRGGRPLVSVPLAGRLREEVLEGLRDLHERGVRDVLIVTGDYPGSPPPKPAGHLFDLDSLQLLMLLRERGDLPDGLAKGCVVSPFKTLEAEVMWQYARLARKIAHGADFVVSQAGYDPRRWDELLRICRRLGLHRPVIGHVLVPDAETARRIGEGRLPGVALPSALLQKLSSPGTGGSDSALQLAALAVAALRGMGYSGVLLSGRQLGYDGLCRVLEKSEELAPRWREVLEDIGGQEKGFYYFRAGSGGGLNGDTPAKVSPKKSRNPMYVLSYLVDYFAFGSWGPMFRLLVRVCRFCDRRPLWKKALWGLEYLSKEPLYGCRMCGDCSLYACGFLCCEAGCPKRMVNGPCGGSTGGYCEVSPGRSRCIWVTVYDRLKGTAERPSFTAPPIPPRDRTLDGTCSWINFCLGRDHRKRRTT